MRNIRLILLAVVIFGLTDSPAFSSLTGFQNPPGRLDPEETLRIKAYGDSFNSVLDPAGEGPHYFVTEQLYDGLVRLDANFNIVPALAEYWIISEDGKRITFYLKKGVLFHDGTEMTAEDVKFSLERLVQERPGNIVFQYFTSRVPGARAYREGREKEVSGFKVIDKYVFEIQWNRPYVSGLYLLSMYFCKVLPRDLLMSQGSRFFFKPVGTGAFKFAYWVRSPRLEILGVRLERNSDYFGKKALLGALEYSPFFTQDQFREGDVHIIPVLSEGLLGGRYRILENHTLQTTFLGMSCRIPPLDNPLVRRALEMGIDKVRLAAAASTPANLMEVTENIIPPYLPGFFPRESGPGGDPEKARLLLEKAGIAAAEGKSLLLCFQLPESQEKLRFFRELRSQLEPLGFRLEMRYMKSLDEFQNLKVPYLSYLGWQMDFPDPENVIEPLFSSGAVVNSRLFGYANPDLDKLLLQSEVEAGWEKRVSLFRKMESILYQDLPAIPLFREKLRLALQPSVRGAQLPAMGFWLLDMKSIWMEK